MDRKVHGIFTEYLQLGVQDVAEALASTRPDSDLHDIRDPSRNNSVAAGQDQYRSLASTSPYAMAVVSQVRS